MGKYIFVILSTVLLAVLLMGNYISNDSMGNVINRMAVTCQANGSSQKCQSLIKRVERGGHYEVISNGKTYWAEYKGVSYE